MPITGKPKGSLFNAKEIAVHVHEPMETPVPTKEMKHPYPSVEIKKAKGGFIAHKRGGKDEDYMNNEYVFKTYAEAVEKCKTFMEDA
ncbi:MAG: hypothetical protein GY861_00165 [bacterium]|nr:hypothetical protein [bacterium]